MALKVIDSHFHVWNLDTQDLPWLEGTDGTITHTYTLKDLEAEYARQAGVEFVGGVYVEVDCADHEAEDKIAYDIKSADPKMLACMLRSDVSPWMRVPAFAAGIREPLHIDSEPKGRCLEPSFIDGLHAMAAKGLLSSPATALMSSKTPMRLLPRLPRRPSSSTTLAMWRNSPMSTRPS